MSSLQLPGTVEESEGAQYEDELLPSDSNRMKYVRIVNRHVWLPLLYKGTEAGEDNEKSSTIRRTIYRALYMSLQKTDLPKIDIEKLSTSWLSSDSGLLGGATAIDHSVLLPHHTCSGQGECRPPSEARDVFVRAPP